MIVTPLSNRAAAVRDALLSHGWEGDLARLTAGGIDQAAFHVTAVAPAVVEAMVPLAARLGLELVTGDDWLLLIGGRSRLGAFARPWVQPEAVQGLAQAIGMSLPLDEAPAWRHARGTVRLDHPVIVGIVNVTPDSFSDGGNVASPADAVRRVHSLLAAGATMVDVGGESTRPGAAAVDGATERGRVVPVIEALAAAHPDLPIAIDTVHAGTAEAALAVGAAIVNDVTAGRHDPEILDVAARHGAAMVLSHSRGPLDRIASYDEAEYSGDVAGAVARELNRSLAGALAAGVAREGIVLDPGFGFSKTAAQSLALLHQLDAIVAIGLPVLVGVSRKRFLGEATGRAVDDRDRATAAACALAYERGARLFRVHDPAAVRDALQVADAASGATC